MVIYADILFAVNAVMDLLCLFVTGKVMNFKMKKLRLAAGAVIGGIYGVLSCVFNLCEPWCAISCSALMIFTSFDIKDVLSFVKSGVLFYSVGMLLGGIMTFFQRIIYENKDATLFSEGVSLGMFAIIAIIIFILLLASSRLFSIYIHRKNVECIIKSGDKSKKVRLLLDTGNNLRDPYTGKAVIILKAEVLDELLGKDGIHRRYTSCDANDIAENRLHFISVKTVNGSSLLPVIGSLSAYSVSGKGKEAEIHAVVGTDTIAENGYSGNDGIMPYMLESSF